MDKINQAEYIAFIESNTTGTGCLFLQKALEKGYRVIFLSQSPEKYPFLKEDLIQAVVLNTEDEEEIYAYLNKVPHLAGVFSSSEYFIEMACRIAKRFALKANEPSVVNLCRNKGLLAQKLSEASINCPKTISITALDEVAKWNSISKICYPVIVKPAQGSGSIGVKLCQNALECSAQLKQLLQGKEGGSVLVQEYIEGKEFSVETLSTPEGTDVVGITQKHLGEPPYFVETGHDFPAVLAPSLQTMLEEFVIRALEKIHFKLGPAHTEIRIRDGLPYIIEINPRLAGGMIPQMIKAAVGVDMIDLTLDVVLGKSFSKPILQNGFASIRFLLPRVSGYLRAIHFNPSDVTALVDFTVTKPVGEKIILQGDFRDRIGYLIVQSSDPIACQNEAEKAVKSIDIDMVCDIQALKANQAFENTGRLKSAISTEVQKLLSTLDAGKDSLEELNILTNIDEAHLVMLHQKKLISLDDVRSLLNQIRQLKKEQFESLKNKPAPRGMYFLYENELINALGIEIAGQVHRGRSRNDMNATSFKLKLRARYFSLYKTLWNFRSDLVTHAKMNINTPLPIYSQYQTALPGTYGHYLLAIFFALDRDRAALQARYSDLDVCPLGAGAGGGTAVNIDPIETAKLLGFSDAVINSLDAVASRDLASRILADLSIMSITVSRFVEDLQLWSTNEFKFIEFPDELSGGSSMMPQKKNPYLLEKVKGRLAHLLGDFVSSTMSMQKVPFGNSVEVGTEAVHVFFKAIDQFIQVISLLGMVVKNVKILEQSTRDNLMKNLTIATYLTDELVAKGPCSFREAHHLVGDCIWQALDQKQDPLSKILELFHGQPVETDPLCVALKMDQGGGPGSFSVHRQYHVAVNQLNEDANWLRTQTQKVLTAELLRQKQVDAIAI